MRNNGRKLPAGIHTITPQLVFHDASRAIEFLQNGLGGELLHKTYCPDGKSIMHAAVQVGDSTMFVTDASSFAKPTSANLFVYVDDVDAAYQRAVAAGA